MCISGEGKHTKT